MMEPTARAARSPHTTAAASGVHAEARRMAGAPAASATAPTSSGVSCRLAFRASYASWSAASGAARASGAQNGPRAKTAARTMPPAATTA